MDCVMTDVQPFQIITSVRAHFQADNQDVPSDDGVTMDARRFS